MNLFNDYFESRNSIYVIPTGAKLAGQLSEMEESLDFFD